MDNRTRCPTNETSERKDVEVMQNEAFKKDMMLRTPPSSVHPRRSRD
jgi:hypothetical protein